MAATETFTGEVVGEAYAAALIAVVDQLARLSDVDRLAALLRRPELLAGAMAAAGTAIPAALVGRKISFIRGSMWADPDELGRGLVRSGIDPLMSLIAVDEWMTLIAAASDLQSRKIDFEAKYPRRAVVGFPESLASRLSITPSADQQFIVHRIAAVAAICVMEFKHGRSGERTYFRKRGDRRTPNEQRSEIESALREGKSAREIARLMNLSHKQVSRIRQRMLRG